MKRCFILGAGFSKAVGNLPLMCELSNKFWELIHEQQSQDFKNRVLWGKKINDYFSLLERTYFIEPCIDLMNGEDYTNCNYKNNLEAIISFIDLNLSGEIRATKIDKSGNTSDFTKTPLFWNYTDLDELKICIQTYLYLALINPEIDNNKIEKFFDLLSPGDSVITFNYDLLLETTLFKRERWFPHDGYGIGFLNDKISPYYKNKKSENILLKLHGSLNWEGVNFDNECLNMNFYYDDQSPIFPDYLLESKKQNFIYEGKHSGFWVLPSYLKNFYTSQILFIWQKAFEEIIGADEIIIIGYSLPKEDSAACILLGTTHLDKKKILLVDPNYEQLIEKYKFITKNNDIILYECIENYIENNI